MGVMGALPETAIRSRSSIMEQTNALTARRALPAKELYRFYLFYQIHKYVHCATKNPPGKKGLC